MQRLGLALESYLKSAGLEKGVTQQRALVIWSETVGEMVGKNTEVESVEHGIIKVKVSNSSWRQELQFKKKKKL
jgi:predicted nucleic acid-binding Zn ribbon protein